ncbi:hypothetical protein CCACVL1_09896 [Corchorus capsularis]|uniref:Uncharacterized protein n=1 Tax=Corchorus capsularis TaxID=210143 RepID=A0A1R3ITT3_COCAP|nr:hypothetical protein CCACVL1_09896 [Corchorus capsularis]
MGPGNDVLASRRVAVGASLVLSARPA